MYFNTIDLVICGFYMAHYAMKFYVAQHRFQYIIQTQSLIDLTIILPVLLLYNYNGADKLFVFI